MDTKGGAEYSHLFDAYRLNLQASYLHSKFNYYCNTFGKDRLFDDDKQRLEVFQLSAVLYAFVWDAD